MSDVIAAKKERLQELLNSRNAATAITYTNCWPKSQQLVGAALDRLKRLKKMIDDTKQG